MKNMSFFKACISILLVTAMLPLFSACNGGPAGSGAEGLVISEVVSANSMSLTHEELGSPDWIELHNASARAIDLKGYGLSDNVKNPHQWTFPAVTIPAGGYLVVYATKYSGTDSSLLCTGFGLSKSGETVYLTDAYYNLLQQLTVPTLLSDVSYALADNGEYGYCSAPTPGKKNDGEIVFTSAAAAFASGGSTAVSISEVMPRNNILAAADGGYYSFAELYNDSDESVLLSDFYLSDSLSDATKWHLPEISLAAKSYCIVFLSGQESDAQELHAPFRIGSKDDILLLSDRAGSVLSALNWDPAIPEGVSVTPGGYTVFPTPDGANSAVTAASFACGQMDGSDPVQLSEVLLRNKYSIRDEDGDRSAWVELHNVSASAVSLKGYFISDDSASPFKWALPDVTLDAGGYLTVFLDGKNRAATDGQLHTAFTLSDADGVILLTDATAMRTDSIEIEHGIGDNISIGRDDSGARKYYASPTPGAKNSSRGFDALQDATLTDMSGVYISEVSANKAAHSTQTDWIELHNASASEVSLAGWTLSDDPDEPSRYVFADTKIAGGGYLVVNASTKTEKGVTAPFGISDAGETLVLCDAKGDLRDVFETGALRLGVSSGRMPGSARRVFFTSATKGAENSAARTGFVSDPVFSDTSLYHTDSLTLSITCATPGASIHYTIDGSTPTANSARYTGPLTLNKNTPVRAIATLDGLVSSDVTTSTNLFDQQHTVPVVCLCIGSEDFEAVYSVTDRWKKVERGGYFEYYEPDGTLGTSFGAGLRASGASTLLARQKSLAIFLRSAYGPTKTGYPFFGATDVDGYTALVLRNSGQDRSKARVRDSYFMRVVKGLNIEAVDTRIVVAYINGQYWGLYDLNENQNEDYLEAHYGVDADAVDIIRRNETPLEGTRTDFKRVRSIGLNGDLSSDAKFAEFCEWVDVDYFIDYLIAQTFFSNGDMFNQKYWRSQDYAVKWRPVYFDLDFALNASSPTRNILSSYFKYEGVPSQDGSLTNMDIYVGLRKNKAWCEQFGERYVYVVKNYFTVERMTSILDRMEKEMEPEMARHIARWSDAPNSVSAWKSSVAALRKCLEQREPYALKYLKNEFGFTDAQMSEWTATAEAASRQAS